MRILLLCDRYPYPLDNGQNLRIYHYVRELMGRHQFDLLCYGDEEVPPALNELFTRAEAIPRPTEVPARGLRRFVNAWSVEGMFAHSPAASSAIERLHKQRQYDLVWVSGWHMIVNVPRDLPVPTLADVVDDGVLERWNELTGGGSIGQRLHAVKRIFMNYLFENQYFGRARTRLVVSERDAKWLKIACHGKHVDVVRNGVDTLYYSPLGLPRDADTVVFEGKVGFSPNADGVVYFIEDILPRIHEQRPGVKFKVVGKDPPPRVQALAGESVSVTGFVDDVRPYVDQAAVFVCPLRKGAGIKNKVLQAWAMGKAVVATPQSIGGLDIEEGKNILVRERPTAFAQGVLDLLNDPERANAIGQAARKTAVAAYSWSEKAQELEQIMARSAQEGMGVEQCL